MTTSLSTSDRLSVRELVPMRTHVCLPGDLVLAVGADATVAVGGGLRVVGGSSGDSGEAAYLVSEFCAPAAAASAAPSSSGVPRYTLASPAASRYTYTLGDPVVAVVARKVGSLHYYCYTGGAALASLDAMAFDGATKASRPRLVEGDVLFARVKATGDVGPAADDHNADSGNEEAAPRTVVASSAAAGEPELSCTAADVGLTPKDWTSGESVFGLLPGGQLLSVPLPYARSLLTPYETAAADSDAQAAVPASYLLALLGARVPFEVCVGMNGLMWVRGQSSELDTTAAVRRTVAVCACLTEAQYDVTREEMEARVAAYFPEH